MQLENDALAPGRVIAGRYRLEHLLGRGGMGTVWRAEHLALQSPVAIKVIDPIAAEDEASRKRFLLEARAAAALRSTHIVQILDHGVDEDLPYIVMELLSGESLQERLDRERRLSPAQTARIVSQMAKAVGKAHDAGIVHRDLKPANVFLAEDDDAEIVKVLDFGVAKHTTGGLDEGVQTTTGALIGTPFFMSPEQAEGDKAIDWRSDVWSIGVVAFQCMTGRLPFEADNIGALVMKIGVRPKPVPSEIHEVPDGFDAWFDRATDRAPSDRFPSVRAMSDALNELIATPDGHDAEEDGASSMNGAAASSAIESRADGSRSSSLGVVALGAVVLVAVGVAVAYGSRDSTPTRSTSVSATEPLAAPPAPEPAPEPTVAPADRPARADTEETDAVDAGRSEPPDAEKRAPKKRAAARVRVTTPPPPSASPPQRHPKGEIPENVNLGL